MECQAWELRNKREVSCGWEEARRALHAGGHLRGMWAARLHGVHVVLHQEGGRSVPTKLNQSITYVGLDFRARCFNSVFVNGFRNSFSSSLSICFSLLLLMLT